MTKPQTVCKQNVKHIQANLCLDGVLLCDSVGTVLLDISYGVRFGELFIKCWLFSDERYVLGWRGQRVQISLEIDIALQRRSDPNSQQTFPVFLPYFTLSQLRKIQNKGRETHPFVEHAQGFPRARINIQFVMSRAKRCVRKTGAPEIGAGPRVSGMFTCLN